VNQGRQGQCRAQFAQYLTQVAAAILFVLVRPEEIEQGLPPTGSACVAR